MDKLKYPEATEIYNIANAVNYAWKFYKEYIITVELKGRYKAYCSYMPGQDCSKL